MIGNNQIIGYLYLQIKGYGREVNETISDIVILEDEPILQTGFNPL